MKGLDKNTKLFFAFFGTICAVFLLYFSVASQKSFERSLSYEFSGVINTVTYDVKGIPTVLVNNRNYYLSAGYDFRHLIEKGDTLKKIKGSNIYTLVKINKKVISFNN